jgi:hypothetical protein
MPSPITMQIADQTTSVRLEGLKFDGVYDPTLAAFIRFDETIGAMSTEAEGPQGGGTTSYGEQVIRGTGTAAGADAVDMAVEQTVDGFSAEQTVLIPAPDPASPAPQPFTFAYAIDSATVDVTLAALKARKLLDVWAYAVARAQESPPNIDEHEVKKLLTELIPLFQRLDEGGTLSGLRIATPLGEFGLKDAAFKFAVGGIVPDAGMAMSINLGEPSFPSEIAPPWAKGLVPTEVDVGFDVSGFNLDAAARHLLEAFDADRTPPLQDADWEAAGQLTMPEEGGKLTLLPGHIDGPLLDIEFEGEMTLAMPAPTGTFTLTATGLDDAMASLNAASGDPTEAQVLGFLTLAKMWGRPAANGATEFVFDFKSDGSIAVNGNELKPANSEPL